MVFRLNRARHFFALVFCRLKLKQCLNVEARHESKCMQRGMSMSIKVSRDADRPTDRESGVLEI